MKTVALAVALSLLLFLGLGNHADWRGLLGGAEGIRTSDVFDLHDIGVQCQKVPHFLLGWGSRARRSCANCSSSLE
jgi:hypothetical protein